VPWRLLSNRVANDPDTAVEPIDWYRAHWEIEMFFHVLKNGCRVEALQLTKGARLKRALALFAVLARRIVQLKRLDRTWPDLEAELLFERDEWKSAYIRLKKKPPKTPFVSMR
jgi:hypothetical protein